MKKIYLDAGHGGADLGAVANGLYEKDVVLAVQQHIISFLSTHYQGFSLCTTRTTDVFLSLNERANKANAWGADVYLSIHINSGGETGYEDFIYSKNINNQTIVLRNDIHDHVKFVLTKYNHSNRGRKLANYSVLRRSYMPSVLTEIGFIDTEHDAKLLKNPQFLKDMGVAYAKGIAQFLNLEPTSTKSVEASDAESFSKPTFLYKPLWIKTTKDTNTYRDANMSERTGYLKKNTLFQVYSETHAAWIMDGEHFIEKKDTIIEGETITTAELTKENLEALKLFVREEKLETAVTFSKEGAAVAIITLHDKKILNVKAFLDREKWWYKAERIKTS
ncbi:MULTISPECIES: N-acetylmuramoyl-L-alanine amidase family protein [Priestia]|uniref:N-acetylmuramoyl-L-alanine amidase family protein n=1 Tax=Priestia TaxID=2800373 RepID=UPI001C8E9A6F|nr:MULTISPECIES: N-acetylmuramoyl-L-alanine amidase [Priestia]MBY0061649.1 N-acetylmuramoyl-L-alanine amidase [Priestia aryabhattai]MDN3362181.1 N-acetylmuramoyl-L-alanine amidase [Priestia megaterium]WKU21858.1 N-acetylmuramoyl-L-alanine amidase [Priestia megaterium]